MSIAEIQRRMESYNRVKLRKAKEEALQDYVLADLIGRSVARIYSKEATYPSISEVYPNLFDAREEIEAKEKRQAELSVLRFKQFANSYTMRRCKKSNE